MIEVVGAAAGAVGGALVTWSIQRRRNHLASIVASSAAMVAITDVSGTIMHRDASLLRATGLAKNDRRRASIFDRIHPDDIGHVKAAWGEAVTSGRATTSCRMYDLRDRLHRVDMRLFNGLDDRHVKGIVVDLRRITDRHAIETRYHTLVDTMAEGVWMVDTTGRLEIVSASMAALLHATPSDVMSRSLYEFVPTSGGGAERAITEAFTGKRIEVEHELRRADGSTFWARTNASPILALDGSVTGIVGVVRDITDARTAATRQQIIRERYGKLQQSFPGAVFETDELGVTTFFTDGWSELTGDRNPGSVCDDYQALVHPDDRDGVIAALTHTFENREPLSHRHRMIRHDGDERWVELRGNPTFDENGSFTGYVGVVLDETEYAKARMDAEEFAAVIAASADFVIIYGLDGTIRQASQSAMAVLAVEPGEPGGLEPVLDAQSQRVYRREVLPELMEQGQWKGELTLSANGLEIPVSASFALHADNAGNPARISVTAHDISELRAAQLVLARQASHDSLTGLPNRRRLVDVLNDALLTDPERTAVLFIDLDGFKGINDIYGHPVGDELLVAIGRILEKCVRPADVVTRHGGDEFVVVLAFVDEAMARDIAARILDRLRSPIKLSVGDVTIGVSIGIHMADHGDTADGALIAADRAMYGVKTSGKHGVRLSHEG
ncbi:MAG: diguanylate cyclase [Acidimicrobiia bacterium]